MEPLSICSPQRSLIAIDPIKISLSHIRSSLSLGVIILLVDYLGDPSRWLERAIRGFASRRSLRDSSPLLQRFDDHFYHCRIFLLLYSIWYNGNGYIIPTLSLDMGI